jgi:ribosomal protein L40E
MDEPEFTARQTADLECWRCGAPNEPDAKKCWMCHLPLAEGIYNDRPIPQMRVRAKPQTADDAAQVTMIVLSVVAITVGLGCFAQSTILGIAYAIVAVPGLAMAFLGTSLIRSRGSNPTPAATVAGFALISFLMIPLAVLAGAVAALFIVFASIAAFFQACGELLSAAS